MRVKLLRAVPSSCATRGASGCCSPAAILTCWRRPGSSPTDTSDLAGESGVRLPPTRLARQKNTPTTRNTRSGTASSRNRNNATLIHRRGYKSRHSCCPTSRSTDGVSCAGGETTTPGLPTPRVLPDQRQHTAVAFLSRAWFAQPGIVKRMLTDNGSCYSSKLGSGVPGDADPGEEDPSLPTPDQRQGRAVCPNPVAQVGTRAPTGPPLTLPIYLQHTTISTGTIAAWTIGHP